MGCRGIYPPLLQHARCVTLTMPMMFLICGSLAIVALPTHSLTPHFVALAGRKACLIERVVDAVAHELGLDPLIVRQRNFYPEKTATVHGSTHYGQTVT